MAANQVPRVVSEYHQVLGGFPGGTVVENLSAGTGDRVDSWVGKIQYSWQTTPVFLPGESHGQKSLAGYSPWGCKESDVTEHARGRKTIQY